MAIVCVLDHNCFSTYTNIRKIPKGSYIFLFPLIISFIILYTIGSFFLSGGDYFNLNMKKNI